MDYLKIMAIICPLVFLAGFVDSIAGGGGLISLPAFLFTGIPAHMAYGCNKVCSSIGTTFSTARFLKNKAVDIKIALVSAAAAFAGAWLGTNIVLLISEQLLKIMIVCVLPVVAVILLFRKPINNNETGAELSSKKAISLAIVIGVCIGFYDGVIGPGTGTFAILAYNAVMGYSLKTASGNAKILNLSSNYASSVLVIANGAVLYNIALPAALFNIVGHYIGSGLAIKKGDKFIKPMLAIVMIMLFSKILYDMI